MKDLATLASRAIHESQSRDSAEEAAMAAENTLQGISPTIRKLFMLLHGSYGSLFTSKFATGQMAGKHDKGAISAMRVWDAKLSRFTPDVIEDASNRLSKEHPKHPPNLPEFESLCESAAPRKEWAREQGLPRLPAPAPEPVKVEVPKHDDGKNWARSILARDKLGDKRISRYALYSAEMAMGLRAKMS